jgi:hypothetical protein
MAAPPWLSWWWPAQDFAQRVNTAGLPADTRLTGPRAWYRTPAQNIAVGGSGPWPQLGVGGPPSQHLVGTAADLTARDLELVAQRARERGMVAVTNHARSYVHVQLWPKGVLGRLMGLA